MIQYVKQQSSFPGLYFVSLQVLTKKRQNFEMCEVNRLKKAVPFTQAQAWFKTQSVNVITHLITRYCNQREHALKKSKSAFSKMDAMALKTIRTRILNQTDFNRLCKAIVDNSLCLTRLTHEWSMRHEPTMWDTVIPNLIDFANNNIQ